MQTVHHSECVLVRLGMRPHRCILGGPGYFRAFNTGISLPQILSNWLCDQNTQDITCKTVLNGRGYWSRLNWCHGRLRMDPQMCQCCLLAQRTQIVLSPASNTSNCPALVTSCPDVAPLIGPPTLILHETRVQRKLLVQWY